MEKSKKEGNWEKTKTKRRKEKGGRGDKARRGKKTEKGEIEPKCPRQGKHTGAGSQQLEKVASVTAK